MLLKYLLAIFLVGYFFLGACVTVQVGNQETIKAHDLKYQVPALPFSKHKDETVDAAWISNKTGNVIAFSSDCPQKYETPTETLIQDALHVFENSELIEKTNLNYNERTATLVTSKGTLEGIPMIIKSLIFKKNGCNFKLIYSGLAKEFPLEQNIFNRFIEEFKVP